MQLEIALMQNLRRRPLRTSFVFCTRLLVGPSYSFLLPRDAKRDRPLRLHLLLVKVARLLLRQRLEIDLALADQIVAQQILIL